MTEFQTEDHVWFYQPSPEYEKVQRLQSASTLKRIGSLVTGGISTLLFSDIEYGFISFDHDFFTNLYDHWASDGDCPTTYYYLAFASAILLAASTVWILYDARSSSKEASKLEQKIFEEARKKDGYGL